ncbi:MAG: alanine racemase [Desulfobacterales bacterium]|nr:alanine racemase [Desulfobacterales bacterium]
MENGSYAEINLDNLVFNVREIQKRVQPARVIPVVKADAYGHGAAPVTFRLMAEGFKRFAVARFQEAMELRESGVAGPILVFERLFPPQLPLAIDAGLEITVFGEEDIRWIEHAGGKRPAAVHLNVETGMGRMGVFPDQEPDVFDALVRSTHCAWKGLFSHFSTSDEKDKSYAEIQLFKFKKTASLVREKMDPPPMMHMANSGAILDIPGARFDAVRPGVSMYGCYPSMETSRSIPLRQVMTLRTHVAHVRNLPAGHPVSYGRRWIAKKPTKIAVLPVGYADGVRRQLTNRGEVLIRGRRYPMVGRVTMDHIMVDIGDDPIHPGDEVVLWGESAGAVMPTLEVAEKIGAIPYELTCGVTRRIRRVYIGRETDPRALETRSEKNEMRN